MGRKAPFTVPAPRTELRAQHLGRIDLDDDFRLEILARAHVHVRVRDAREAIGTGMAASPVRVDGPAERHRVAGDVVDDRLRFRFDELDPAEMRGVERPAP